MPKQPDVSGARCPDPVFLIPAPEESEAPETHITVNALTDGTHTWKPALAVGRTAAVIDERGVTRTRGRKSRRADFADILAVRLVEIAGRQSATSLVLTTRRGKLILHCGVRLDDALHDENARAFVRACAAALAALGRARPDLEVSHGGGPFLRGFMALMGVALAGIGACLAILALAEGGMGERIFNGLAGGVLAWAGAAMAISFSPFQAPPRTPVADVARNLAELAAA